MRLRLVHVIVIVVAGLLATGVAPVVLAQCDCPGQGDLNDDGVIDSSDRGLMTQLITFDFAPEPLWDPACPTPRSDYNADGVIDVRDMLLLYDTIFSSGPGPEDPCACGFPCAASPATGSGSVVVESKDVVAGLRDSVGVFLSNTTALDALMIPLVVRAIDTYPTEIRFRVRDGARLSSDIGPMPAISMLSGYDTMDGHCAGGAGTGFGTVTALFDGSWDEPLAGSSPDGLRYLFFTHIVRSPLLSGSDGAVPSLDIVFVAPAVTGMFEIDTSCSNPDNHLAFFEAATRGEVIPSFSMGVITVGCMCPYQGDMNADGVHDSVDLSILINALFFNVPDERDVVCPFSRGDYDGSGVIDSSDLNALIGRLFFNGPLPVDPCGA